MTGTATAMVRVNRPLGIHHRQVLMTSALGFIARVDPSVQNWESIPHKRTNVSHFLSKIKVLKTVLVAV